MDQYSLTAQEIEVIEQIIASAESQIATIVRLIGSQQGLKGHALSPDRKSLIPVTKNEVR